MTEDDYGAINDTLVQNIADLPAWPTRLKAEDLDRIRAKAQNRKEVNAINDVIRLLRDPSEHGYHSEHKHLQERDDAEGCCSITARIFKAMWKGDPRFTLRRVSPELARQLADPYPHTMILHPQHSFRLVWDYLVSITVFVELVLLPLHLGFDFPLEPFQWTVFCD